MGRCGTGWRDPDTTGFCGAPASTSALSAASRFSFFVLASGRGGGGMPNCASKASCSSSCSSFSSTSVHRRAGVRSAFDITEMCPSFAGSNHGYRRRRHAIPRCNFPLETNGRANLSNLSFCELGEIMSLACGAEGPPFLPHVAHVVVMRSKKEMIRIKASLIVAAMQHHQPRADRFSFEGVPRKAMNGTRSSV